MRRWDQYYQFWNTVTGSKLVNMKFDLFIIKDYLADFRSGVWSTLLFQAKRR